MQQEEEIKSLRRIVRECQELVKCQGWDRLLEYAEGQIKYRESLQAAQSSGFDSMIQKEFVNGELSGIRLFLAMPELIITDFEDQVTELLQEQKDESTDK